MTKITDIEDARFLKAANLPLNLRIKQRTFSLKYSRRWVDLMKAHTAFVRAVNKYTAGARAGSPGKWKLMQRRLTALDQAAVECIDFVDKLGGNVAATRVQIGAGWPRIHGARVLDHRARLTIHPVLGGRGGCGRSWDSDAD
jgi:hypothetical protein